MNFLRLCLILFFAVNLAGCGPTYPKETLTDAVVDLCLKEYKIDIKSELVGKTLAIYIPLPSLFNITLGINEDALEVIQDVMDSTRRVFLSTDAEIDFYCIIAQDIKYPEFQVVIIKRVDDYKRVYFRLIRRDEYFKRMIIDRNINPQAKKERNIKDVFKKYNLDPEWEEEILDEFFRSTPLGLKDFGYWQDRFYVKDITLPEFLAEQMARRIRMKFLQDDTLSEKFFIKEINANYENKDFEEYFYVYFDIRLRAILEAIDKEEDEKLVFENIFTEMSDCLYGYKFQDFDHIRIVDINTNKRLVTSRKDVYAFKKQKMGIETILGGM